MVCPSLDAPIAEMNNSHLFNKKYFVFKQECSCIPIRSVVVGFDDSGDAYSWEYEHGITQVSLGKSIRIDRD